MNSLENLEAVNTRANNGEKVKRPWKINGSGTFAPYFSINYGDPRLLPIKIEGSGMASYIGRCNVVLEWCSFGLGSTTDIITGIITAANADGEFNEYEYRLIFNLLPEAGIHIESAL